ncbi:MAG: hypothetical protein LBK95_19595 [Bifidobacteriaceae bacterium]|nr:hypothetical protein [Bifidobacteriaceae bacterium]
MRMAVVRRSPVASALWAVALAGSVACSSESGDSAQVTSAVIIADARDLEKNGYAEQAAMLQDGVITAREYQDAFDLMRKCVEDLGMVVDGPYTNRVDSFSLSFSFGPGGGEDAEWKDGDTAKIDECEDRYWIPLDVDYEGSHVGRMDPLLREAMAECLPREGFKVSGDELTLQDFVGEQGVTDEGLTPRAEAVAECVRTEGMRLYPEQGGAGAFGFE